MIVYDIKSLMVFVIYLKLFIININSFDKEMYRVDFISNMIVIFV